MLTNKQDPEDPLNYNLREGLRENVDFKVLINKDLWAMFKGKYGLKEEGK